MKRNSNEKKLVQDPIIKLLNLRGFYVFNANAGKIQTKTGYFFSGVPAGTSDIIGIAPDGKMVAIECKYDKGRPTEMQKDFIYNIERKGGVAFCTNSIEDCLAKLNDRGYNISYKL